MDAKVERREFLRGAIAAGLVIGFPWPRARGDEQMRPLVSPLAQARAEMERRGAPGVLIVVPAHRREQLTADLNRVFGGSIDDPERGKRVPPQAEPDRDLLRLFARAVFVCEADTEVGRALGPAAAGAAVVRLDPDGSVAELVARDSALVNEGWEAAFVSTVVALLDGPEDRRLEAAAAHQRAAFPALAGQADAAFAQLDAAEFVAREDASAALLGVCDRWGNVLVLAARRTTSLEVRTRIEQVLAAYVARLATPADNALPDPEAKEPAARLVLPLGVRWSFRQIDPCPGCGMGSAPHPVRRYLALVAGAGR